MSERNSKGEDVQVDEIKEFVAGTGIGITLSGGEARIKLDIGGLTEITTALDSDLDYVLVYDSTYNVHKLVKVADLPTSTEATNVADIQFFGGGSNGSTSGTYYWTKPADAKAVYVIMCGAGGGGGAGGTRGAALAVCGGNAGGAGGVNECFFPASVLASSVAVIIGAGGAGATGHSTNATVGATGSSGGVYTSFGDHMVASCGVGGAGGILSTTATAAPLGGQIVWNGQDGAASNDGSVAGRAGVTFTPGGGGPGTGITAANVIGATGGNGGWNTMSDSAGAAGGSGAGANGTDGVDNTAKYWFGGGGGGGVAGLTVNGGNGGNGYGGGGGGGGGAARDGYTSGNGGAGGDGICIVVTFF